MKFYQQNRNDGVRTNSDTRLRYLDGLRALAALFVVATHVMTELNKCDSPITTHQVHWYNFGFVSVCVFIVLSGYCLTLPYTKSNKSQLPVGATVFFQKRARRILPPYYAACILSLIVIIFRPSERPNTYFWANSTTAFQPQVLLSHALLVHNLTIDWAQKIDFPLWSIATEWQIYFLFPLLLFCARRMSLYTPISVAFLIGVAVTVVLVHFSHGTDPACGYLLGLFAMGIVTCLHGSNNTAKLQELIFAASVSITLFTWIAYECTEWAFGHQMIQGILVGITSCTLLLFLSSRTSTVRHLLQNKALVKLGEFSYSLYLIHVPILAVTHMLLISIGLFSAAWLFVIGIPISICASYIFHLLFERPYIPKLQQTLPADHTQTAQL